MGRLYRCMLYRCMELSDYNILLNRREVWVSQYKNYSTKNPVNMSEGSKPSLNIEPAAGTLISIAIIVEKSAFSWGSIRMLWLGTK